MLEIAFVGGNMDTIRGFTDYCVAEDERLLYVYKGSQVIGFYNLDQVLYIKFIKED